MLVPFFPLVWGSLRLTLISAFIRERSISVFVDTPVAQCSTLVIKVSGCIGSEKFKTFVTLKCWSIRQEYLMCMHSYVSLSNKSLFMWSYCVCITIAIDLQWFNLYSVWLLARTSTCFKRVSIISTFLGYVNHFYSKPCYLYGYTNTIVPKHF